MRELTIQQLNYETQLHRTMCQERAEKCYGAWGVRANAPFEHWSSG
jgi:hypothetical protein